ncbi:methionyl-tRNA formyltransferase [Fannyhessea vaginae]|uniref:methionyl-tRNA formyltransferase n=1 Tax=Fannyhessea vaginae TaxID=82135 RepID=UPI0023F00DF0|nr:methionyl-tRNA formyltransferase [Fannyhessea vaginae]
MNIVYMGTPDFSVKPLQELHKHHKISLVITRPDAVRGRGKKLIPSPVKQCANALSLPVREATRFDDELISAVKACEPDVIVVAAYGCIIPDSVLALPRYTTLNIHASLLPRWRGAAPIQRAILSRDEVTGVSIMNVVHELDAGDFCRQASLKIGTQSLDELTDKLSVLGARELLCALSDIEEHKLVWHKQSETDITYAQKIDKHELLLDPSLSAESNVVRIQASGDAAPARFMMGQKGLRALVGRFVGDEVASENAASNTAASANAVSENAMPESAVSKSNASEDSVSESASRAEPIPAGSVLIQNHRVFLGCASGTLELLRVKPDGKSAMSAHDWSLGLHNVSTWSHVS